MLFSGLLSGSRADIVLLNVPVPLDDGDCVVGDVGSSNAPSRPWY